MPAEAVASSANPAIPMAGLSERQHGFNLFIVGFLVLFLELACIRWFAAYVVFLQFFTNVVLIAAFLGVLRLPGRAQASGLARLLSVPGLWNNGRRACDALYLP